MLDVAAVLGDVYGVEVTFGFEADAAGRHKCLLPVFEDVVVVDWLRNVVLELEAVQHFHGRISRAWLTRESPRGVILPRSLLRYTAAAAACFGGSAWKPSAITSPVRRWLPSAASRLRPLQPALNVGKASWLESSFLPRVHHLKGETITYRLNECQR